MKRWGWLMILAAVLLAPALVPGGTRVQAAGGDFEAWLYDPFLGMMMRVSSDGSLIDEFVLPNDVGGFYAPDVAVSPDGTVFAYMLDLPTGEKQFRLYSRPLDTVLTTYTEPGVLASNFDFGVSTFNFDGSRAFAFGFLRPDNTWGIYTFELTPPYIRTMYESYYPMPVSNNVGQGGPYLPVVRLFVDNKVTFTTVIIGAGGAFIYPAYTWDLGDPASPIPAGGPLTPDVRFVSLDADFNPMSGETIAPLEDLRFATSPDFMMGQANTLQVYDNTGSGAVYPVYHDPAVSFFNPRFMQAGERLLTGRSFPAGISDWVVLDRSGALLTTLPPLAMTSADDVMNGFIYTTKFFSPDGLSQLWYVNMRHDPAGAPSGGTFIYTHELSTSDVLVVWTSDLFMPFVDTPAPWPRLADPLLSSAVLGAPPLPSPTPGTSGTIPTPAAVLAIGGAAEINATEGDSVNVRSGAGTGFAIVARLNDGDRVILLEGPVSAGGLLWWRVRTPSGAEGWVVQDADGVQVLIPLSSGSASLSPSTIGAGGSAPAGTITVGATVQVVTDALNVRATPSRSAGVSAIAYRGDRLTVIGGPTSAETLTWWQVRTAGGITGWVVETVDGERTINPATP